MATEATVAWRALLDEATARLAAVGLPTPEVDARRLVEQASGAEGSEVAFVLDTPATQRGVAHFDAMLARRADGEPLQYVLGEWGFRHLDLFVDPRVLIPRPETETVVEYALAELDRHVDDAGATRVVDLGTGSGAIALALAYERPTVDVWATDLSVGALEVARANLAGLGRAGTRVQLSAGSWFEALAPALQGQFAVVVSNPPYIADAELLPPEVDDWEPRSALRSGPSGTEAYDLIIEEAWPWIAAGGSLVLELAPHQADYVMGLARGRGYVDVAVHPDLAGRDRVLVARRPDGVR